ncbi:MAG: AhpC/TSA family protein [Flavobacteriales bacterium]|nr:AhpC/TSA family protein [Flavobacteriales bacterium]
MRIGLKVMSGMKHLKNLLWLTAVVVGVTACGGGVELEGDDTQDMLPQGHVISGKIEGGEGQPVMLLVFEDGEQSVVDSTKITNGEFKIKTKTLGLRQYVMMIGGQELPIVLMLDAESRDVKITGSIPGIGENYQVSGSKPSQEIIDYMDFLKPTYPRYNELTALLQSTPPDDTVMIDFYLEKLDSISAIRRTYAVEHIEADSTSPTNWLLLRDLFPASGLENFDTTDLKYFQTVANGMRSKYPDSDYPDLVEADMESVKAQLEALKNPQPKFAPGEFEYAPDITLDDYNGKPISLSSLRGQVVLIDFWASWCKPCRMENPNVVRAYDKWKDKGFTVYSVSLDEDKGAWMKAIESDNLSWPNHVSDLKGWTSPVAFQYGVNSIPNTFLIDQEGKVIGRNLRGGQLEQKLQEILG